jgi:hypothetical protein
MLWAIDAGSPRDVLGRRPLYGPLERAPSVSVSCETAMLRRTKLRSALLAAFILPFAASLLANAQQKKVGPAQKSDAWLVGLPLYSSDGKKLGQVTEVVAAAGQGAVRAEMGTFLGLGPTSILIPEEMVERKPDRVEIIMTASEIKTFATRQRELKAKR